MRWLSCACLALAACPEVRPQHHHADDVDAAPDVFTVDAAPPDASRVVLDAGHVRRPDAWFVPVDAGTRTFDAGPVIADAAPVIDDAGHAALPDARGSTTDAMPIIGSGLVQMMRSASVGGATGNAKFTHELWIPDVGTCVVPTGADDGLLVGKSVDVALSTGEMTFDWVPSSELYAGWGPTEGFYLQGATWVSATAPGDQAPGFSLRVAVPNGTNDFSAPGELRVGDDVSLVWLPAGVSRVTAVLSHDPSGPEVACAFSDTGGGVIPGAYTSMLGSGSATLTVWFANEAVTDVGGWRVRLWSGDQDIKGIWLDP
jgi:hypothetical protein